MRQFRLLVFALVADVIVTASAFPQPFPMARMESLRDGDTFAAARLSHAESSSILEQVGNTSFDYPDSWPAELRARRVSLGDVDGLVVRGTKLLCGATGNCQTWVFRRANGRWISMFEHDAPVISAFGFADSKSWGIPNLVTLANDSAEADDYREFTFDGRFYHPMRCGKLIGSGIPLTSRRFRQQPCANAN